MAAILAALTSPSCTTVLFEARGTTLLSNSATGGARRAIPHAVAIWS
ncbi:MAG: hypothetical protein M3325_00605 [Actinomycetota bacterium]|nr:hypothetical protein [Actinomycetota bacterium]